MEHLSKRINDHPHKQILIGISQMVAINYQIHTTRRLPTIIDLVNKTREQNMISLHTAFGKLDDDVMLSAIVTLDAKLREDHNFESTVDPLLVSDIITLSLKLTHYIHEDVLLTSTVMCILFYYPSLADDEILQLMIAKLTYHLFRPRVMFITLAALISINNEKALKRAMDILPKMNSYDEFMTSELSAGLVLLMHAIGREVNVDDLITIQFDPMLRDAVIPFLKAKVLKKSQKYKLKHFIPTCTWLELKTE